MLTRNLLLIASLIVTTPIYADTAPTYQRIDFQTDVEKEIANDLLYCLETIENGLANKMKQLIEKIK